MIHWHFGYTMTVEKKILQSDIFVCGLLSGRKSITQNSADFSFKREPMEELWTCYNSECKAKIYICYVWFLIFIRNRSSRLNPNIELVRSSEVYHFYRSLCGITASQTWNPFLESQEILSLLGPNTAYLKKASNKGFKHYQVYTVLVIFLSSLFRLASFSNSQYYQ